MSSFDDILRPKPPPRPIDPRLLSLLLPPSPPPVPPRSIIDAFLKPPLAPLAPTFGALNWPVLAPTPAAPVVLRRKAFISYHHANDEAWKVYFENTLGDAMDGFISKAVGDGDIDPRLATDTIRDKIRDDFLQDATVTIVLVGIQTWQRRHVDWEISSSLRNTKHHNRCGLVGILLPGHPGRDTNTYDPGIVPPRLVDNVECGYAKLYHWADDVKLVRVWVEEAFARRSEIEPDNSRESFVNNRTADRWR